MRDFVFLYLIALAVFLIIDSFWLGLIARRLYRSQIGFLLRDKFNFKAAGVFYLFYLAGLVFFVITPAESWTFALLAGLFFGFITYATYDITNLATIKDWPVKLTIIDIVWGSFIAGITSLITFLIAGG